MPNTVVNWNWQEESITPNTVRALWMNRSTQTPSLTLDSLLNGQKIRERKAGTRIAIIGNAVVDFTKVSLPDFVKTGLNIRDNLAWYIETFDRMADDGIVLDGIVLDEE